MGSININPSRGFDPAYFVDDPDNPINPSPQLNGTYFNSQLYFESFGDSVTAIYSNYHTLSFWYKIGSDAIDSKIFNRPILTVEDSVCYKVNMEVEMSYNKSIGTSDLNVVTRGLNVADEAEFYFEIPTHDDTWHHIAIYQKSWDGTGASVNKAYLDGVSQSITVVSTFITDKDFAYFDYWAVGAGQKTQSTRFEGCLSELYYTFDFLDISADTNINKFRNPTTGKPVGLGTKGELPTGNPAYIYLTGSGTNFAANKGTRSEPFIIQGEALACSKIYPDSEVDPLLGFNAQTGSVIFEGQTPSYYIV